MSVLQSVAAKILICRKSVSRNVQIFLAVIHLKQLAMLYAYTEAKNLQCLDIAALEISGKQG